VLQRWQPESSDKFDGSLEKSSATGTWDQFSANEQLFGLKTDYDENMYTTAIDKSHPQYRDRVAAAEKKAREIERSLATTSHVAEERIMDHAGGDDRGGDEEDK
jgi:PAB1-binding protein PBP1